MRFIGSCGIASLVASGGLWSGKKVQYLRPPCFVAVANFTAGVLMVVGEG